MSNAKVIISRLIGGLKKKVSLYELSQFPEQFHYTLNKITVELNLANYVRKLDLKISTGVHASEFSQKVQKKKISDADKKYLIPVDF